MTFRRPGAAGGPGAVGGRPEREKYGFVYTKPYFGARLRIQLILRIYRIQRIQRIWCQQLLLGASLPHAPVARMT